MKISYITGNKVKYTTGYKYRLEDDSKIIVTNYFGEEIETEYISFTPVLAGTLITVKKGYAWDGASGIKDRKSNFIASLFHDAGYQLLRELQLEMVFRYDLDRMFQQICIDNGAYRWQAWIYYKTLRRFGRGAADSKSRKVKTL